MSVSAILLAAGESRRMGQQKALLPWEGTTLIAYQLTELSAVDEIGEVIVVTGHEPDQITEVAASFPRATTAPNPAYRTGKVSSILCGLRAVADDAGAIVLLAVDQPRSTGVMRALIERHAAAGAAITAPAHGGRRGHPLLFDRALLPELLAISEETQGVREVLRRHAADVLEVECDANVLVDLNRPDDVRRAAP